MTFEMDDHFFHPAVEYVWSCFQSSLLSLAETCREIDLVPVSWINSCKGSNVKLNKLYSSYSFLDIYDCYFSQQAPTVILSGYGENISEKLFTSVIMTWLSRQKSWKHLKKWYILVCLMSKRTKYNLTWITFLIILLLFLWRRPLNTKHKFKYIFYKLRFILFIVFYINLIWVIFISCIKI